MKKLILLLIIVLSITSCITTSTPDKCYQSVKNKHPHDIILAPKFGGYIFFVIDTINNKYYQVETASAFHNNITSTIELYK